jgi:hypothetical protein
MAICFGHQLGRFEKFPTGLARRKEAFDVVLRVQNCGRIKLRRYRLSTRFNPSQLYLKFNIGHISEAPLAVGPNSPCFNEHEGLEKVPNFMKRGVLFGQFTNCQTNQHVATLLRTLELG